mgnify:CR=1 FL=1
MLTDYADQKNERNSAIADHFRGGYRPRLGLYVESVVVPLKVIEQNAPNL